MSNREIVIPILAAAVWLWMWAVLLILLDIRESLLRIAPEKEESVGGEEQSE